MHYRTHQNERLSEIGFGCYALGGSYGQVDPERFVGLIRRAYDLGVTVFDTADIYGPAEEVLGRSVAPFRDRVWIATKVGWGSEGRPDCSPDHIHASCDSSLQRLATDYIDLYQVHFYDPNTPIQETLGALVDLKAAGKIRHYGLGHLPPDRMDEYLAAGDAFSVLTELSAVARGSLERRLPLCRHYRVGVIAFSVTGRGLLTGKIRLTHSFEEADIRRIDPLFQRERLVSGLRIADRLRALAASHGRTPVQAAIAWVLAQSQVVCALTGPSTVAHLEENLGSSGWTMDPEVLASLDRYLAAEEERVRREQIVSLHRLLTEALKPQEAFADLVYALETLVERGLVSEEEIMPFYKELMPLRKRPAADVAEELEAIHAELQERFLPLVTASRLANRHPAELPAEPEE